MCCSKALDVQQLTKPLQLSCSHDVERSLHIVAELMVVGLVFDIIPAICRSNIG